MDDLRWILARLRPEARALAAACLLGALSGGALVALMALGGALVAVAGLAALAGSGFPPAISQASAGLRLATVARTGGSYGERLLAHAAVLRVVAGLRGWIFVRLAPLAPDHLGRYRTGDLLQRLLADVDGLTDLVARLGLPMAAAILVGIAIIGLLAPVGGAMAAVTGAALLVLLVGVPIAAHRLGRGLASARSEAARRLRVRLVETFEAATEVVVHGAAGRQRARILQAQKDLLAVERRQRAVAIAARCAGRSVAAAGLVAVLWLGLEAAGRGTLPLPLLAAVVLALLSTYEWMAPLLLSFEALDRGRSAAARLRGLQHALPPAQPPQEPIPAPGEMTMELERVSYGYPGALAPALSGLDITLEAGERVLVVGHAGAGKSTLADLLLRLRDPTQGTARLGGVDMRRIAEPELRALVGGVVGRPLLFAGTLGENLLMGRPEACARDQDHALALAGLEPLVESLPDGLQTTVGGGEGSGDLRLSGGQVRRIALARFLLRKPRIMVLDEPTEGLDPEAARRLVEGLLEETARRDGTLVVVTHRMLAVNGFDRVLVLDRGRILEDGPPGVLMRRGGRFSGLLQGFSDAVP